ncbi:MAG: hypothetical protein IPH62_19445, partial [Ignavibacteriae bacterium]|nr:hypothetical protein [Ignavibacteriota bacterium]
MDSNHYLKSYINLDTKQYVISYLNTDSNHVEEEHFDTEEQLEEFKHKLGSSCDTVIDNFLKEKSEDDFKLDMDVILRFKKILELGFNYVIMHWDTAYLSSNCLIDFIFNHYSDKNVNVIYENKTTYEGLLISYVFDNFGNIPITVSHDILEMIGYRMSLLHPEIDADYRHFYNFFLIVFNEPKH